MVLRVTEGQIANLIYLGTQRNLGDMANLQLQTSTGMRINSYADDPSGVGLVRHYESLISQNEQYQRNIDRARNFVDNTDTALQDLLEVLRDANQVALREASGASSTWQTRAVGATEVEGYISEAMSLLNQTVEGSALFGGYRTDLTPFIRSSTGEVIYRGDDNAMSTRIAPSSELQINVNGSTLLGSDRSVFAGFGDLSARLAATTALTEISGGEGWTMGSIQFTDSTGVLKTVDLSGAGTIGDVIDLLDDAGLSAAIAADGQGLEITDPGGGPLTISDVEGGSTAMSLGIVGSSDLGLIEGADIRTPAEWVTNLAAIDALTDAMPLGEIQLEMNGTQVVIDLAGAATLADVQSTFEAAVVAAGLPALRMELSGGAINIVSDTAASWSISNTAGDTTAEALGIEGSGKPARLFGTLEALADALRADDEDAIRAVIGELEAIEQTILEVEMGVASRQSMLDWSEGLLIDRQYQLNEDLSLVRDADIIEVASELAQAESAYQASLLVSSKLLSMNLFQYL